MAQAERPWGRLLMGDRLCPLVDPLGSQSVPSARLSVTVRVPHRGGDLGEHSVLSDIAATRSTGVRQVALSWLLRHADNILLIPGTSSIDHLEQNMTAGRAEPGPRADGGSSPSPEPGGG